VNLVDRGFDLAIRIGLPQDSSLVARKLLRVRLVLVASDRCLAEQGLPAGPALSSTTSASSTRTSGSLAAGTSGRSTPSRRFRSPGACASPTARLSCGGRGGPFDAGPAIATGRLRTVSRSTRRGASSCRLSTRTAATSRRGSASWSISSRPGTAARRAGARLVAIAYDPEAVFFPSCGTSSAQAYRL
jgi:hypothetical protein